MQNNKNEHNDKRNNFSHPDKRICEEFPFSILYDYCVVQAQQTSTINGLIYGE
jgi:hypothetical protein